MNKRPIDRGYGERRECGNCWRWGSRWEKWLGKLVRIFGTNRSYRRHRVVTCRGNGQRWNANQMGCQYWCPLNVKQLIRGLKRGKAVYGGSEEVMKRGSEVAR